MLKRGIYENYLKNMNFDIKFKIKNYTLAWHSFMNK
jgi:hypothetical protein